MIHDFIFAFVLYEGIKCFRDECLAWLLIWDFLDLFFHQVAGRHLWNFQNGFFKPSLIGVLLQWSNVIWKNQGPYSNPKHLVA